MPAASSPDDRLSESGKTQSFPPLWAHKPSEVMAAMLKLSPRGPEDLPFFTFFYLHRLPRELQLLLKEMDFHI
jgi:hypothetical protein